MTKLELVGYQRLRGSPAINNASDNGTRSHDYV